MTMNSTGQPATYFCSSELDDLSRRRFRGSPHNINDLSYDPNSGALVITFDTQQDLDAYWAVKKQDPSITTYAPNGKYSKGKAAVENALRALNVPFSTAEVGHLNEQSPRTPAILIAREDISRGVYVLKALLTDPAINYDYDIVRETFMGALDKAIERANPPVTAEAKDWQKRTASSGDRGKGALC